MTTKKTIEKRVAALEERAGRGRNVGYFEEQLRATAIEYANLVKFWTMIDRDGNRVTYCQKDADDYAEYSVTKMKRLAIQLLQELAVEESTS